MNSTQSGEREKPPVPEGFELCGLMDATYTITRSGLAVPFDLQRALRQCGGRISPVADALVRLDEFSARRTERVDERS